MQRSLSQEMAIAILLQLVFISAWIAAVFFCTSALPVPDTALEEESWMKSALLTLRDLAVSCKLQL